MPHNTTSYKTNMTPDSGSSSHTVIVGAGVIGLSTAYYLSESGNTNPNTIHLLDSSDELFHCASGFAAGFLAADWFAPSVAALGKLSFKLHASLAKQHSGRAKWGYSLSTGISISPGNDSLVGGSGEDWLENGTSRAVLANHNRPWEEEIVGPQWLRRSRDGVMEVISRDGTIAQIDSLRFCKWMLQRCKDRGVQVHQPARASEILQDKNGVMDGLVITEHGEDSILPCTRLVITSGAWTPRVFSTLFPSSSTRIPVSSLAGHSILVRNPHWDPRPESSDKELCHAVFAFDTLGFSPELFARLGGELYLSGLNSMCIPLPDSATDVTASPKSIAQLVNCARAMVRGVPGQDLEILREGLCFRPVTPNGRPIISRIPDDALGDVKTQDGSKGGVFIAAGHGAWGISQGPATGLVMTELIEARPTSAKIEALRFIA